MSRPAFACLAAAATVAAACPTRRRRLSTHCPPQPCAGGQMEEQLFIAGMQGKLRLVQDMVRALGGVGAPAVLRALSRPHPTFFVHDMLYCACRNGLGAGFNMVSELISAYGPVGSPAVLTAIQSGPPENCLMIRVVRNVETHIVKRLLQACGAPGCPQVLQVLQASDHALIRNASIYGHDDTLCALAIAYGAQGCSSLLTRLHVWDDGLSGDVREALRASLFFANFLLPLPQAWSMGTAFVISVTSRQRRQELALPILLRVHQFPPIIKEMMHDFFRRRPWQLFG